MKDPYESYYRSADTGIIPTRVSDKRIYPKEYVLGLVLNEKAKAYPFSVLSRQFIVNDTFQGAPLLVIFDSESAAGAIFKRQIEGKTLSFKQSQQAAEQRSLLTDDVNGLFDTDGIQQGSLKGKKLEPIPMTTSFWFGWVDHYPNTELYRAEK